jgi:hypothetical protein
VAAMVTEMQDAAGVGSPEPTSLQPLFDLLSAFHH